MNIALTEQTAAAAASEPVRSLAGQGSQISLSSSGGSHSYSSRDHRSPRFRPVPGAPSSSESDDDNQGFHDPLEQIARRLFDEFDLNGDGLQDLKEFRALGATLNMPPVTEESYKGVCKDLGISDSDGGIPFEKFLQIYSDPSFGANLAEDFTIVFGEAPP